MNSLAIFRDGQPCTPRLTEAEYLQCHIGSKATTFLFRDLTIIAQRQRYCRLNVGEGEQATEIPCDLAETPLASLASIGPELHQKGRRRTLDELSRLARYLEPSITYC
jgi:hypothetical protein